MEKSRRNWKLKISNTADNAANDIIQSQARDTRHRRMQEVNSLCTDSGPLRANTVLCHSTQYSLLVAAVTNSSRVWTSHVLVSRCTLRMIHSRQISIRGTIRCSYSCVSGHNRCLVRLRQAIIVYLSIVKGVFGRASNAANANQRRVHWSVCVITGRTGNEQVNWQVGRTSHGLCTMTVWLCRCMAVCCRYVWCWERHNSKVANATGPVLVSCCWRYCCCYCPNLCSFARHSSIIYRYTPELFWTTLFTLRGSTNTDKKQDRIEKRRHGTAYKHNMTRQKLLKST